jgi:hypothetical protein
MPSDGSSYPSSSAGSFTRSVDSFRHRKSHRSVPFRTSVIRGIRPGTEVWAINSDARHINFIIPGRNVV